MRLTVGPLPPAVYWRRRALILGAVLAVVLLIALSCSGESGGNSGNRAKSGASGSPGGSASATAASTAPSVLVPTGPEPSVTPPIYGTAGDGTAAASSGGPCADAEIAVVPALGSQDVRQGASVDLYIKIKNISARTCVRDVGAQMQELYVQQGGTRQWSSDLCENRGSTADLVTFPPGHERSYSLTWPGKANAQGCANQQPLPKGTYQLFARVGTKISDPVTFTIA
jgi:hypothetical protein